MAKNYLHMLCNLPHNWPFFQHNFPNVAAPCQMVCQAISFIYKSKVLRANSWMQRYTKTEIAVYMSIVTPETYCIFPKKINSY